MLGQRSGRVTLVNVQERVLPRHVFATITAARRGAYTWIDSWYNARRHHSAIGYLSPLQYEHQLARQAHQTAHRAA